MAIDTTVFAADIPAGTYAVGDVINLGCIDGPANVRSGRGPAKLKSIIACMLDGGSIPYWKVHIKNSDWIDEVQNYAAPMGAQTAFDEESGASQSGHDCDLTPNSGWQVYAECVIGGSPTAANSIFALIDIDYPQVGGVTNPKKAVGLPTSISYETTVTSQAFGALVGSTWSVQSVDYFKAGYRYVLDSVEVLAKSLNSGFVGFIAFSNAAGMGGLTRIIPMTADVAAIRYGVNYSSILVKGPMDVKTKIFQVTPSTVSITMAHDYVKQKA